MSIRKRTWQTKEGENSAWVVDYRDQHGKRRLETFPRKKDAVAWWEGKAAREVREGTHTPESESISIGEAGENWIRVCEKGDGESQALEASTVREYKRHLNQHIKPFIGAIKLSKLSVAGVSGFKSQLADEGRSPAMVRKIVTSLGSLVANAQDKGQVARNVVREVSRRKRRNDGRHKKHLEIGVDIPSKSELKAILNRAAGKWRPLVVTAVFTGLRASELRGLRWCDVDFKAGLISVRQRADRFNVIGSPKSGASKRSIPMAPMVSNVLKEWQLQCPNGDLNLVFPNGAGKIENLTNIRRRCLGPVQFKAGLGKDPARPKYGLHSFRHAAASMFIEQGFTPKRVQVLMGHSSIAVTFDTYGHLFPTAKDDAQAMEQIQIRLVGG